MVRSASSLNKCARHSHSPPIRPKYRVAIEKRIYLSDGEESVLVGIPNVSVISQKSTTSQTPSTTTLPAQSESVTVTLPMPEEVREGYLEIREVTTGHVVTVIEVLSPTNKRPGKGREAYEDKRREVLSSPTHLVEIDLLRGGQPMRILSETLQTDYRRYLLLVECLKNTLQQTTNNKQQTTNNTRIPRQELAWDELTFILLGEVNG